MSGCDFVFASTIHSAYIDMQKGEVRQDNSDGHVHFSRACPWVIHDEMERETAMCKLVWISTCSYPNKVEIMLCYASFDTAESHAKRQTQQESS